jgi:hypothetical protein
MPDPARRNRVEANRFVYQGHNECIAISHKTILFPNMLLNVKGPVGVEGSYAYVLCLYAITTEKIVKPESFSSENFYAINA